MLNKLLQFAILIIFLLIPLVMNPKQTFAQNCEKVLEVPEMDQHLRATYNRNLWLRFACDQDFTTIQQVRDAGVNIGLSIDDVPVGLSYEDRDKSFIDWKRLHCSSNFGDNENFIYVENKKFYISELKYKMYKDCLNSKSRTEIELSNIKINGILMHERANQGLSCSLEQVGEGLFICVVSWKPRDGDNTFPKVTSFVHPDLDVVGDNPDELAAGPHAIMLRLKQDKKPDYISVTIQTTLNNSKSGPRCYKVIPYLGQSLKDNLVGEYLFQAASPSDYKGSLYDSSKHGHDAEVNNFLANATLAADRFGHLHSAVYLHGNPDQEINLDLSDDLPLGKQSRSISIWVKADDDTPSQSSIIGYGDGRTTKGGHFFINQFKSPLSGFTGRGVSFDIGFDYFSTEEILDNNWHHIVLTYNGKSNYFEFYIDGKKKQGGNVDINTIPFDKIYQIRVGNNMLKRRPFKGFIDDVRIYNNVLHKKDVQKLYEEDGWKK